VLLANPRVLLLVSSPQELQLAAAHGVSQDRIIFANPCKRPADFRYAQQSATLLTGQHAAPCGVPQVSHLETL